MITDGRNLKTLKDIKNITTYTTLQLHQIVNDIIVTCKYRLGIQTELFF